MVASPNPVRIGVYGPEESTSTEGRGCSLWPVGYAAAVEAAGATPVVLGQSTGGRPWAELLADIHGLVWTGRDRGPAQPLVEEERLCHWCRKHGLPFLAVDHGLHVLNASFGGTVHLDLCSERPEALQHRHPPEKGLRHAINVLRGTHLARIYGEGELVVNSEHRRGIAKVARGFRVGESALDGIVEGIEAEGEDWFAIGVQWRPASWSASGLDIQLFRGLVEVSEKRLGICKPARAAYTTTAA
jgi:putative glutamine amidotransferase